VSSPPTRGTISGDLQDRRFHDDVVALSCRRDRLELRGERAFRPLTPQLGRESATDASPRRELRAGQLRKKTLFGYAATGAPSGGTSNNIIVLRGTQGELEALYDLDWNGTDCKLANMTFGTVAAGQYSFYTGAALGEGRLPLQLICPAEAAAMGNSASQGYTLYKFRVTELRILAAGGDAPDLDTGVPVLPTGLQVETVADRL
jgi:hypothetical protein